jgi:mRNA (guanine-N7-)-methyltransferase
MCEALATRRSCVLYTYKRYANAVKRQLIISYARGANCLVDVGCGRGGDISKWRDACVKNVVATDLSAAQLEEARARELR